MIQILTRKILQHNDKLFEIVKIVSESDVAPNNTAIQAAKDYLECDACLRSNQYPQKLLFCRSITEAKIIEDEVPTTN